MHPILLPLGTTLLQFHKKAELLWSQTPTQKLTRTITKGTRAGNVELVTRRVARALTDGAKWTGEFVLKAYWKQVHRLLSSPLLLDVVMTDTGIVLPSLLINARDLNQMRTMTERSMRNHLTQLKNVGVISGYKWHGRKRSFELWINPEYVLKTAQNPVEKHAGADSGAQPLASLLDPIRKKFPPNEFPEIQETQICDIGDVEMLPTSLPSEKPFQETEVCTQAGGARQASISDTGAAGAQNPPSALTAEQQAAWAEFRARKKAFVLSAWLAFKGQIYQGKRFTAEEESRALKALYQGEYRHFPVAAKQAEWFQTRFLARITLLEQHLERLRKKGEKPWTPMPYATLHPGCGYFDVENTINGFIRTVPWLKADQERQQQQQQSAAVTKAVNELHLRYKIDRGTYATSHKNGRPRRIAAQTLDNTLRQLFNLHRQQLQQVFGSGAVRQYCIRITFRIQ